MEIELLDELQNTKFDEEDLRKEIALHLQKADAIKREYEDKSANGLKEIELLFPCLICSATQTTA